MAALQPALSWYFLHHVSESPVVPHVLHIGALIPFITICLSQRPAATGHMYIKKAKMTPMKTLGMQALHCRLCTMPATKPQHLYRSSMPVPNSLPPRGRTGSFRKVGEWFSASL